MVAFSCESGPYRDYDAHCTVRVVTRYVCCAISGHCPNKGPALNSGAFAWQLRTSLPLGNRSPFNLMTSRQRRRRSFAKPSLPRPRGRWRKRGRKRRRRRTGSRIWGECKEEEGKREEAGETKTGKEKKVEEHGGGSARHKRGGGGGACCW